jgi:Holliday junction resolvase-like predicted endonuclease
VARVLESQGARLIEQRYKTPFGEVDLFMVAPSGAKLIVEVKSVRSVEFAETRVSRRQRKRLQNVVQYLAEIHSEVEFMLALVDDQNKVQIFDDL